MDNINFTGKVFMCLIESTYLNTFFFLDDFSIKFCKSELVTILFKTTKKIAYKMYL